MARTDYSQSSKFGIQVFDAQLDDLSDDIFFSPTSADKHLDRLRPLNVIVYVYFVVL